MKKVFYGHLDRLIDEKKPYAIWGAGWTGKTVKDLINQYKDGTLREEFVIDNNSALWDKNGVISPEKFWEVMDEIDTVFVCVYVADEVVEQLLQNGFKGHAIPVSSSIMASDSYAVWYENSKEQIDEVIGIAFDEQSKNTIKTFYEVAKSGDISLWDRVNGKSEDKLLDPEILQFSDSENMVEIGAFTGDTTHRFIELCGGSYKSILGLEPDPENYRVLSENYNKIENAKALELAASDKNFDAKFTGNMSESGYISENGDITVKAVRLDSVDEALDASFIKVSTNGFDLAALLGAEEIIKKNKPKLSYYCAGSQLWFIPQYLKRLVPEYKIYVRHYGIGMQAMIGYAVI